MGETAHRRKKDIVDKSDEQKSDVEIHDDDK